MNVFIKVGAMFVIVAIILLCIFLILEKGTGKRLRHQLEKEYEAK